MSDQERDALTRELKRAFAAATARTESATLASSSPAAAGSMSFTAPLLAAVLAGGKTQTRRPVRPAPDRAEGGRCFATDGSAIVPLAQPGDRLWVREKWARDADDRFVYAIDGERTDVRWISSRFMPRAAARSFLDVHSVGVERLSAVSAEDAVREGAEPTLLTDDPRVAFFDLWDSIYGETEFASRRDPWVWKIEFTLVRTTV